MNSTLFLRLTGEADKAAALETALKDRTHSLRFETEASSFRLLEGSPFAYWVRDQVRHICGGLQPFEGCDRLARRGPSTGDDAWRVRAWWEVRAAALGTNKAWTYFAKGGAYSPYYADIHLVTAWDYLRGTFRGFLGRPGRPIEKPESADFFFRPGLTWPRRTSSGLSLRAMAKGCIFADKAPSAFVVNDVPESILSLLAITNSKAFSGFVALHLAAADAAARSYEVGIIQRTPVPPLEASVHKILSTQALAIWSVKQKRDQIEETSHAFLLPALLIVSGSSLVDRAGHWDTMLQADDLEIMRIQNEIDERCWELYGIENADRTALMDPGVEALRSEGDDEDEVDEAGNQPVTPEALVEDFASWLFGAAMGRWDAELATGKSPVPPLPGPFDQIPVVSRGMLLGANGLHPARDASGRFLPEHDLLVDDEGHDLDLVQRALTVLAQVAGAQAEAWQQELEGLLGSDLRTWYRSTYFERHLKRHSKSRRKAPVYWQLGTSSSSYSVWLYYPRLTQDSLYRVLNETVKPKVQQEEQRLTQLRQAQARASDVEAQETFVEELRSFQDEVARVAPLFAPNLDDGVLLNAAPLWRLTPHSGWRKDTKAAWEALVKGEYDWSHLALKLWTERVIPKCAKERHLALAHDLEGALKTQSVPALIAQHTRPAVQEALAQLQAAPALGGASRAPRAARVPRASQAAQAPESDAKAEPAILRVLADFPEGAAKAEVLARIRLSDGQWNGTIAQLLAQGRVRREGEKRGTKYFLNS